MTLLLNVIIKNKDKIINSIDADLEKLKDSRDYAEKAFNLFNETSNKMNGLRGDVQSCFNGEAAEAFYNKLTNYCVFCDVRCSQMESQIVELDRKIDELEKQKKKSEDTIAMIQGFLDKFGWL